jgi:hypothetical protein
LCCMTFFRFTDSLIFSTSSWNWDNSFQKDNLIPNILRQSLNDWFTTQKTNEIQNETHSKVPRKVSGSCSTSGTPRSIFDRTTHMLWVVVCAHFQNNMFRVYLRSPLVRVTRKHRVISLPFLFLVYFFDLRILWYFQPLLGIETILFKRITLFQTFCVRV